MRYSPIRRRLACAITTISIYEGSMNGIEDNPEVLSWMRHPCTFWSPGWFH